MEGHGRNPSAGGVIGAERAWSDKKMKVPLGSEELEIDKKWFKKGFTLEEQRPAVEAEDLPSKHNQKQPRTHPILVLETSVEGTQNQSMAYSRRWGCGLIQTPG